jgi:hypothetical protein
MLLVDNMGGECSTHGSDEKYTQNVVGKPEGNLGVDGKK